MSHDRLRDLSQRLQEGDASAAEEIFLAYAPYLRMVVRRRMTPRLRARFDSQDVVQAVWSDTLLPLRDDPRPWQFVTPNRLRAFLVRLTLSRFIDFCRRHRAAVERETPLSPLAASGLAVRGDRPSEVYQADELWSRLLGLCAPSHREILELRLSGLTLHEIADRTGFHESSVRRILYDLADRLHADEPGPSARPA